MKRISLAALVCVSVLAVPSTARAGSMLFEGSGTGADGVTLSASALFTISGDTLKITLRNLGDSSGTSKDKSANTLTGVFFDLPDGITLTPTSAKITAGDLIQGNLCDIGPCDATTTNVGGEFVSGTGTWSGHAGNQGISSSGYINGDVGAGNFNGPDLDSPDSPNGINFGIIAPITASNPFNPQTSKNGGSNMASNPLIEGEVVFTMAISGGTLLESAISNVSFQYGTDIRESKFNANPPIIVTPPPVPEPVTLLLLAPALGFAVRRRLRATARPDAPEAVA